MKYRWERMYDALLSIRSYHSWNKRGSGSIASSVLVIAAVAFLFYSCSDNDDATSVGFETTQVQRVESDSTYSVRINLGKVTAATTVTIDIYGTAALDGDYEMVVAQSATDTTSGIIPITVGTTTTTQHEVVAQPGDTYAVLSFKIIDDPYVEPRPENIYFHISSISNDNIQASLQNADYQFVITDNDTPPTDAMQVDLSWQLGDGVSITNGNFDMYLVKNVVISSGQVTSRDMVSGVQSINTTGFESYKIDSSVPDDKYYIMIRYVSGTYDADTELILSKGNSYSKATSLITVANGLGKDYYFGPITKSGTSFSRVAASDEEPGFIY